MTRLIIKPIEATVGNAGPKAATLAQASAKGLPVPPFVVVTADAYSQHAARAGVRVTQPAEAAAAIRSTALAFDLGMALTAALRRLGPTVAVRSSGTAEDLPGLSFAGQYETALDVDAEGVDDAVLECWASLWSERAVAYREHSGVTHERAAMAVIVQRMVAPTLGGVAFTADPVSGTPDIIVESSPEGAEAIVSGHAAPERHTFKRKQLVRETADDAPLLDPDDIPRSVAHLALAAEDLLECPVDIEWAFSDGALWLLQARPITAGVSSTSSDPAPDSSVNEGLLAESLRSRGGRRGGTSSEVASAPGEDYEAGSPSFPHYRPTAWSNVNTGEVLPDIVTPMTWSVVGHVATGLIEALFGKLGVRVDPARLTTLIAGRAYFNASLLGSAFDLMPMGADSDITQVFGGSDAPPGFTDLPIAPEDTARASRLRLALGIPLVVLYFLRHSPRSAARLCTRVSAEARAVLDGVAAASDEDALARVTDRALGMLDTMVDAVAFSGVAMALHGELVSTCKKRFGDDGPAIANTLLAGQGGVASAEAGLALARLGRMGHEEPAVADALRSSSHWAEVRMRLEEAGPDGVSFHKAWIAFLAEHGHHARGELEFGSPRWAECPDDVLVMVVGLLDMPLADDIVSTHTARGKLAAEEEKRVLATLGPLARTRFRWLLRNARAGARMRENLKNEGVRVLAAGRQALLALGASMAGRGVFEVADDILFLERAEVAPVRVGSLDSKPLVASRRAEYDRNRTLTPPPVVIGEWDGAAHAPGLEMPSGPDELTGLGVAAGVARGLAVVPTDVVVS